MSSLAKRLKELREEKGLTQIELGKQLNISQSAISNIEKGQRTASIDVLILLAKFFAVTVGYLLGVED